MEIYFEHVECDLCHSKEYTVRYRKPDTWSRLNQFEFPVVECNNCGLVFVNPRPTLDSMRFYYPENYYDNRDDELHQKRYSVQEEFLPKLTNEKILDIGCARGDFLIYLKKKYPLIRAYGIDYFSDKVNSKDITFYKKLLTECYFQDSEFDFVTAWAVFEHLHKPSEYFKEVNRILRKNGEFIFLVTNAESLYGKKAYIEDIPRHTYHFSEKTLNKYADKYGFKLTNCVYDDRIFDGRGLGTFYYTFTSLSGVTWGKRSFNNINFFQRIVGLCGEYLDKIIFKTHWEAKLKRSGIIVVEFTKI